MEELTKIMPFILGLAATTVFILILNPIAKRLAWVDRPDNIRKNHGTAIPLTGGLAMLLGCVFAIMLTDPCIGSSCQHTQILGAMAIMTLVGLWDDKSNLSPRARLLLQTAVGYLMVLTAGLTMSELGNILGFGNITLPYHLGLFFTVFCIVGAMNAMNMIDGVDGLAGGVTLTALFWMAWLTSLNSMAETTLLLALIGCVTAYLIFNMRHPFRTKASIFMGDAGSMMLGTAMVWLIISLSQQSQPQTGEPILAPTVGLWLVAIPLLDTLCLMINRRLRGKSPFRAGRDHLHHKLQDLGLNDREVTYTITFTSLCLGGLAIAAWQAGIPEYILFMSFLAFALVYFYLVHRHNTLCKLIYQLLRRQPLYKNKN